MNHHHLPPPFPNNRFFTPNPSFNPNPNFHTSAFIPAPPPPVQFNPCQPQPQPQLNDAPPPDLSASLSLLTDLLDLSSTTLHSLSSLLSQQPLPLSSKFLSRCPSNPNHLMPPESLFVHSLHCPSPIAEDVRSILDALHYPKTLKSQTQLTDQNKFASPLSDPHSDLCFSLDDYVSINSNFFYQDCPGVVSSSDEDGSKRIFSLPGVLSVECANLASGIDEVTSDDSFRLLPSELWVIKCEIGQWSDFPNAYSYTVLRAICCIELTKECEILLWMIANSPQFGIIIDPPMRDHIYVLFRLCVKAIVKEAHRCYESFLKENSEDSGGHLNPKTTSFRCPVLVDVLSWLATQLSVLYGEANSKLFIIGMLKELLQNAASSSLVYPLDKVMDNEQGLMSSTGILRVDQPYELVGQSKGGGIVRGAISVYQVAVAIAALHERKFLEDKIKALRNYQYMTAYQRLAEHQYLSKKAQEERENRPNYRPLVDHDGLPVQCQHDKDMADRNKTKEQLLAEERDYKRRRMSYRGKKTKRNVKEVMRNIIEEHMEAIREAGGIGCFDQGVKDDPVSTSKPFAQDYGKNLEFNRSTSYEYEPSRNQQDVYNKYSNSDYKRQTMDSSDSSRDKKLSSSRHRDEENGRRRESNRHDSYPRSSSRERSYQDGSSDRRNGRRKESDRHDSRHRNSSRDRGDQKNDWKKEAEENDSYPRKYELSRKLEREESDSYHRSPSIDKHDRRSSWRNETEKGSYKSRSSSTSGRKDKRRFEEEDRGRRKRFRNDDRAGSIANSAFDDRYSPPRSP